MDKSNPPFGLLIAYLLPGFIGLGGVALLVPTVATWLQPTGGQSGWGIGPPVYAVLAATAMGMVLSCCRWFLVDRIHHWTGVRPPKFDLNVLEDRLVAFNYVVEGRYRYYQFYANTLIAVLWTYAIYRLRNMSSLLGLGTDIGVLILCAILFAGSRDTLAKYYQESTQLVGLVAEKGSEDTIMTNGYHPEHGGGTATSKRPEAKPQTKHSATKQGTVKSPQQAGNRSRTSGSK